MNIDLNSYHVDREVGRVGLFKDGRASITVTDEEITVTDENGAVLKWFGPIPSETVAEIYELGREHFDRLLKRWRHPEQDWFVVYVLDNLRTVRIVDERDGSSYLVRETDYSDNIANDYFAANIRPKPWLESKVGQAWELKVVRKERPDAEPSLVTRAAVVDAEGYFMTKEQGIHPDDSSIRDGVCIWEPSEDDDQDGEQ